MKNTGSILRMILAVVLFYFAVTSSIEAQEQAKNQVVFLESTTLEDGQAEELCKKEAEQENPAVVCFWGEKQDVELACQRTGKTAKVTFVAVTGNAVLVSSVAEPLNWQKNGCFIDTKTAEELFGTSHPDGQILRYGERDYTVCGSFQALQRTMICNAEKEDGLILNAISLQKSSSASADAAEQFMLRNHLTGEVADFSSLNALVKDFLLVLPLLLVIYFIRFLVQSDKHAETTGQKLFDRVLILGMIAAFLWFATQWGTIPEDWIPSRWADMEFWNNWRMNQKQNLLTVFGTSLGESQLAMLWNLMKAVGWNAAAIFIAPGFPTSEWDSVSK